MQYRFLLCFSFIKLVNWNRINITHDKGIRYILITDESTYIKMINERVSFFWKIFPFDYGNLSLNDENKLIKTNNGLKQIINKIKTEYISDYDQMYITAWSESLAYSAAYLVEYFKAEGKNLQNIKPFIDKNYAKQLLINKIERKYFPKYVIFNEQKFLGNKKHYLTEIQKNLRFPIFIKPINGFGSIGTSKINSSNEFSLWYEKLPLSGLTYEIDEFINGDLYVCTSIVVNNIVKYAVVSKYLNPLADVIFHQAKNLGVIPLSQNSEIQNKILDFNKQVINCLPNIGNSVMHHEVFVDNTSNIKFLEITNRVTGGTTSFPTFLKYQFGIDFREIDFKCKMGIDITQDLTPTVVKQYYALISDRIKPSVLALKEDLSFLKSNYEVLIKNTFPSGSFSEHRAILLINKDYNALEEDFNKFKNCLISPQIDISFLILQDENYKELIEFIKNKSNLWHDFTKDQLQSLSQEISPKLLQDRLSVIIKDKSKNFIIGCTLVEKFSFHSAKCAQFKACIIDKNLKDSSLNQYLIAFTMYNLKRNNYHYFITDIVDIDNKNIIKSYIHSEYSILDAKGMDKQESIKSLYIPKQVEHWATGYCNE